MEVVKDTLLSDKCVYVYPWLTKPEFDDFNKYYKYNEPGSNDAEREKNWVECRKRRSLEILPLALLIALIIILISPPMLEPYIDYTAYGIAAIAVFGYLTTEYRARYYYKQYIIERETSGFNQKEFVNFKKKNFGPNWYELL
jgi:hypothetical protein